MSLNHNVTFNKQLDLSVPLSSQLSNWADKTPLRLHLWEEKVYLLFSVFLCCFFKILLLYCNIIIVSNVQHEHHVIKFQTVRCLWITPHILYKTVSVNHPGMLGESLFVSMEGNSFCSWFRRHKYTLMSS